MSYELLFWLLMVTWLLFSFAWNWSGSVIGVYGPFGNTLLIFVLFLLLGLRVYGPMLHG